MELQEFLTYMTVGFLAQLVDGALGMAYGVSATSLLLTTGVSPAVASATVHMSECFTTGASAVSHRYFGNIDRKLFFNLLLPGVIGSVCGAYLVSNFPSDTIRPIVSGYLVVMGLFIIFKAVKTLPPRIVQSHVAPLGFIGAFLDAAGGGGWGPIVASTLIARGNDLRFTVGSVNAVEFFVALSAAATFIVELGSFNWELVAALALGGLFAAPLGAYFCQKVPRGPCLIAVGGLVVVLGVQSLLKALP
jgi:uncharacterized membrane protein YfcA